MQNSLTENSSPIKSSRLFNNFKEGMNFNPFLLSQLKFFHYNEQESITDRLLQSSSFIIKA